MKIKTTLSTIFLSIIYIFTISHADTGYGISNIGSISSITIIENDNRTLMEYSLDQNYPNPFNQSTNIKFTLPNSQNVKIVLFNLLGQKIETLLNKQMPSGSHEIEFNANELSSGIYIYKIESVQFQKVRKMLLLKWIKILSLVIITIGSSGKRTAKHEFQFLWYCRIK